MAGLLFVWLVDLLGHHLLAGLVAQLEDWFVGWLVVQLVGSLVARLTGGAASVAQAFLCLWLALLVGVVGDMMFRWLVACLLHQLFWLHLLTWVSN